MNGTNGIRVHNTLTRRLEPLVPAQPGHVRMYVCGVTVYDYCHVGHARAMVTFDVVVRWLVERGFQVTYVRNYTDVDDKIIARAQELGEDPLDLSKRFAAAFDEDMARLDLVRPTHAPRVSEHIPQVIAVVEALLSRGHAYVAGGDVYFAVETFPGYGRLSGKRLDDLRAGERIAVDERKRHPADFALWKAHRPGEPAWDSPWGKGRPGWHIECSAMGMHYLGPTFDIHGGGLDLVFPHHENEIAQSEGATGKGPFARYWMHNGMVTLQAEKMSKSLGNIVRIRDVLDRVPAETLRMLYLEGHYRSPLPYGDARVAECLVALDRLYQARQALERMAAAGPGGGEGEAGRTAAELGRPARELHDLASGFPGKFGEAMDDDFNTARALAALFDLVRAANRLANDPKARSRGAPLAREALQAFALSGRVLGIGGAGPEQFFRAVRQQKLAALGLAESDVENRLEQREQARRARDWAKADVIRAELDAMGVVVMDGPEGTGWRMRPG